MKHDYTITLHPYGTDPNRGIVQVSPSTQYGYWERRDGTEGGGLWFDGLELTDYDGAFALPRAVCDALVAAGFHLEPEFFPN